MKPSLRPHLRRCSRGRDPWPLVWSLTFHVWLVGVAMGLVWKIWPGHSPVAEPALLEPSDGGERTALITQKPKQESRVVAMRNKLKTLHCRPPSEISIRPRPAPVGAFSPVSQVYLPGGGWNGGVGKSFLKGEGGDGTGPGYGPGFVANFIGVYSRRAKNKPLLSSRDVAIVLDVSGSMRAHGGAGGSPPALQEFIRSVKELPSASKFNVVCFADKAVKFRDESVPATAGNVEEAVAWARERFRLPNAVATMPVPENSSGTSRMDLGLDAALGGRPQEVLLISDGQPVVRERNRSLPHDEILAKIRSAVPDYVKAPVIHTIATRRTLGGFLERLAGEFGGEYKNAAGDFSARREWFGVVRSLTYGRVAGKSEGVKPLSTFR